MVISRAVKLNIKNLMRQMTIKCLNIKFILEQNSEIFNAKELLKL